MSEILYIRNSNINQTLIILLGIPGSGKSYFANDYILKHPNTIILSRDTFRFGFCNSDIVPDYIEELITETIFDIFKNLVWRGYNIILDQTNCKEKDFKLYLNYIKKRLNVEFYIFDIDLEYAKERNIKRSKERVVRDMDMDRMFENYQIIRNNCNFKLYGDVNILKIIENENFDEMFWDKNPESKYFQQELIPIREFIERNKHEQA